MKMLEQCIAKLEEPQNIGDVIALSKRISQLAIARHFVTNIPLSTDPSKQADHYIALQTAVYAVFPEKEATEALQILRTGIQTRKFQTHVRDYMGGVQALFTKLLGIA